MIQASSIPKNRTTSPPAQPEKTSASIRVEISDTQASLRIDRGTLITLTRHVLIGEGIERASISVTLVDDATIHDLNRWYLNHDWPTDVITFRLSDPNDEELSAELIISAEMATTTARQARVDPRAELALYLVHGLLHLCGFNDQTGPESELMRRREGEVLASAGLQNTFEATRRIESADEEEALR